MAVPINNITVFTDKKNPWLRLTVIPTFEMTEGIAKAIPATNVTLKIVMQIMLVVIPITKSEIVLVNKANEINRLIPIRPLKRPANNDSNIPITPNSFTNDAVEMSPFNLSDSIYKFKIAYILINIINKVNEMNKQ